MASASELRYWAFVAGVVGGALILAGALMGVLMMTFVGTVPMGDAAWMMGREVGFGPGAWLGFAVWMAAWGLVTGAVVVVAALRLRSPGASAAAWGLVLVVAGALSYLGMGGFMLGGLLAIVAGVLALVSERPAEGPAAHRV